jgi:hypothetical protein
MKKEKVIREIDLIFGDRHIHIPDDDVRDCQGECFKCDSSNLEYDRANIDGEELSYDYECKDCGHFGKEWYSVGYIETT